MKNKRTAGDEYRSKAIRHAIKKVGDYEKFITVWKDKTSEKPIFNYKIDASLPKSIFDKLRMSIELEAATLNFDVSLKT